MKKLLVLSGSNSKNSINKQLALYAAGSVNNSEINEIDLNDFELPIYSVDRESELGIPDKAKEFLAKIEESDGIVLSLAEYNGSYSSAFKNIMDWASRGTKSLWASKPMLLMATSPGARGGATVLEAAKTSFPYLGANVVASFSLPSFYDNFSEGKISNTELLEKLQGEVNSLSSAL